MIDFVKLKEELIQRIEMDNDFDFRESYYYDEEKVAASDIENSYTIRFLGEGETEDSLNALNISVEFALSYEKDDYLEKLPYCREIIKKLKFNALEKNFTVGMAFVDTVYDLEVKNDIIFAKFNEIYFKI